METDEGIPNLDHFFETGFLNLLAEQLFDLLDQEMISDLRDALGPRCYKIYLGLENPPIKCIQQVGQLVVDKTEDDASGYWKKWLEMCENTCVDDLCCDQIDIILAPKSKPAHPPDPQEDAGK